MIFARAFLAGLLVFAPVLTTRFPASILEILTGKAAACNAEYAVQASIPDGNLLIAFSGVYYWQATAALKLENPKIITGWALAAAIPFLLIFNVRKRLSAFNLGLAKIWFALHVAFGFLTIAFFVIHAGVFCRLASMSSCSRRAFCLLA